MTGYENINNLLYNMGFLLRKYGVIFIEFDSIGRDGAEIA